MAKTEREGDGDDDEQDREEEKEEKEERDTSTSPMPFPALPAGLLFTPEEIDAHFFDQSTRQFDSFLQKKKMGVSGRSKRDRVVSRTRGRYVKPILPPGGGTNPFFHPNPNPNPNHVTRTHTQSLVTPILTPILTPTP